MDNVNVTADLSQGNPVNERDSSFGNNVRGFNPTDAGNKGFQPSSGFSFDKSFGPEAQNVDDEGMTHSANFDGHHIKRSEAQANDPGIQMSSEFSFDKNFGTQPVDNAPSGLSKDMNIKQR